MTDNVPAVPTELIDKLMELYGIERQTDAVIGEIGEFLAEWQHYKLCRVPIETYVSEIVDVYITISELMYVYRGISYDIMKEKLKKIENKLIRNKGIGIIERSMTRERAQEISMKILEKAEKERNESWR